VHDRQLTRVVELETGYRFGKFVRKHRGPVAAATALLLTLTAGLVASVSLYLRAEQSRREAEKQRRIAQGQTQAANRNAKAAQARELVAKARLWREQRVDLEPAVLAAIESLRLLPLLENDRELRLGLTLMPRRNLGVVGVGDFAMSTDGKMAAITDKDDVARVFEVESGRLVASFGNGVRSVQFSPDGQRLATRCADATARVFDIRKAKEVLRLQGVMRVVFSLDGRRLGTVGKDGSVRILDNLNGTEVAHLGTFGGVRTLEFDAEGKRLKIQTDRAVQVFEVAGGREVWSRQSKEGEQLFASALSPNGELVAISQENSVRVFGLFLGGEEISSGGSGPGAAVFTPDGLRIAWASYDGSVGVFEVKSGIDRWRSTHASAEGQVACSPDGRWVVTKHRDGSVRAFEADSGREVARVATGGDVRQVEIGRNGWVAATSDVSGIGRGVSSADDYSPFNPELVFRLFGPVGNDQVSWKPGKAYRVTFSPDWRIAAAESGFFETSSGKGLRLPCHYSCVAAFSPDSRLVVVGDTTPEPRWSRMFERYERGHGVEMLNTPDPEFRTAHVVDISSGRELWHLDLQGHIGAVAFSPDGRWIAVENAYDREVLPAVRVLSAVDGKERWRWTVRKEEAEVLGKEQALAFSPTGHLLAADLGTGAPGVFETDSGRELYRLESNLRSVAFSPDEQRIAAGTWGKTLQILSASTGKEFARTTLPDQVNFVSFSPDGNKLLVGTDKAGHVIAVATGQETSRIETGGRVLAARLVEDQRFLELASSAGNELRITRNALRPQDLIDDACARLTRNLSREEWNELFGPDIAYRRTCANLPVPQP